MKNTTQSWFLLFAILIPAISWSQPISESRIFDWWDDGLVTAEEAQELFQLVEEENFEDACHLAEVLTLDACQEQEKKDSQRGSRKTEKGKATKGQKSKRPSLAPHGSASWKLRADSLGEAESRSLDINVKFYRYSLRLGTRSQLAYRNAGAEAYFGQISTREFHSLLPVDTLWGTSLQYPLGRLTLQGILDTSFNSQIQGAIRWSEDISSGLFLWRFQREYSAGLQFRTSWGEIAGWWQQGQAKPLVKILLQSSTKKSKDGPLVLSWKTSAYLHGKDVPEVSNLSGTLLKNKLSANQMVAVGLPSLGDGKFSANIRVLAPLENDSLKTRLRLAAESGPRALRAASSWTCLELNENCRQNDLKFKLTSGWFTDYTLGASIKARHTRDQGFSPPQIETVGIYHPSKWLSAKMAFVIPKGNPRDEIQIRNETSLGGDFFRASLGVTFRRTYTQNIHPVHGLLQLKWLF